jgi:hypothetical protein
MQKSQENDQDRYNQDKSLVPLVRKKFKNS